jgi:hypothetical protein
MYSERLKTHLNDMMRLRQSISLEEKLAQLSSQFAGASDAVKARMLHGLDHELISNEKEQYNIAMIQDPPELRARRTFGRGGKRRSTAAEMAEKELAKNDRIEHTITTSASEIVNLITPVTDIDLASQTSSSRSQCQKK